MTPEGGGALPPEKVNGCQCVSAIDHWTLVTPDEILAESFAALGVQNAQPLTQGGQKWVFKAELANRPVVAKVVPLPSGPAGVIALERAHREVELLAAVESDAVVKVLSDAVEVGDPPEAVAWVEELLGGADLSASLNVAWGDDDVFGLLSDLARALDACHELSVVHRDLSPGNVRRLDTGRFVLMDPGYAKHLRLAAITGLFQPGTPGFRSPEHIAGGNPTAASDIFSLGILAFFARTNTFPIDPTGDPLDYDRRLVNTQARSLGEIEPLASPALIEVVDRCLRRQPARRFLDGHELLEKLDSIGELR